MKLLIRIAMVVAVAAGGLGLSSCGCCTGEEPVPPLRPLPQFPTEAAPVIDYGK